MSISFLKPQEHKKGIGIYIFSCICAIASVYIIGGFLISIIVGNRLPNESENTSILWKELFTKNELFALNMLPFMVGFATLIFLAKKVHNRSFISFITSRKEFDLKRFLFGFIVWGALLVFVFSVALISQPTTLNWNYFPDNFWVLFCITLFTLPIQTGFEEVFFRGFLFQLLGKAKTRGVVVILINGVLFGALHLMNPEINALGWFAVLFYCLSGVFATLLTLMDDGLELSWGFHTANNFMGVLIVTNSWQALQTDALFIDHSAPSIGWEMPLTLFGLYPLMLLICSKKYGWNHWKSKLFKSDNSIDDDSISSDCNVSTYN